MVAVHQFVPSLGDHTAIGSHTHQVHRLLESMGLTSHTYVGSRRGNRRRGLNHYLDYRPVSGEPTWLLYQLSTGHAMAEHLAKRTEPLIVNYHNITPAEMFFPWEPAMASELRSGRLQLRRLAGRCARGIAVSGYNEAELVRAGYPSTATAPFLADFEELGHRDDAPRTSDLARIKARGGADIVFVGRVAPHKQQHVLIKMLAAYRRTYDPLARLWLIGSTSSPRYRQALARYSEDLGLSDAVQLTGAVTQAELVSYYRNADAYVSASNHEGFGVPLLEAMWHGVPVVALASSGVSETVGDAALMLPAEPPATASLLAAATHRVLDDAALRAELRRRGTIRVGDFRLERSRNAFRAALEPVLAGS